MATTEQLRYKVVVDSKDANVSFKKFKTSGVAATSAIGAGFGSLLTKLNPVTAGLAAGAAGAIAIGKGISASAKAFSEQQKAMANVSTLVDTSIVDMEKLNTQVMQLPNELGKSVDMTKALYQAMSGGVEAGKAVQFVADAARAAKAGLSDTLTAVDAGTTIMNSFGEEAGTATEIFDQMFVAVKAGKTTFGELASSIGKVAPLAAEAGLSTEQLFAATAALTTTGQKTSETITSLKAAISNIIKPSQKASKLAEKLGLDFSASALKTKGLKVFMDDLAVATENNTEKMANMFGSTEALNSMLFLTGKGAKKFKEINDTMANSAGETDTAFEKQMNTLSSAKETLENSLNKLATTFGEVIAPALLKVTKLITKMIEGLTEMVKWLKKKLTFGETEDEQMKRLNKQAAEIAGHRKVERQELEKIVELVKKAEVERSIAFNIGAGIGKSTDELVRIDLEAVANLQRQLDKANLKIDVQTTFFGNIDVKDTIEPIKDLLEEMDDANVNVLFTGEGSSVKPLSEKAKEMATVLNDFGLKVDSTNPSFKVAFQDAAGDSLTNAMNTTERGFGSMFDTLVDGTLDVTESFADMATNIVAGIGKMLASQAISSFVGMLGSQVGGAFNIPGLASGGTALAGRAHVVGEKGPELFIPDRTGTVIPNNKLGGGGGSVNIVNNINVTSSGDDAQDKTMARDIARAIDEKIKMTIATQMRPGGLLNSSRLAGAR